MNEKLCECLGNSVGEVYNVDTRKVTVHIANESELNSMRINDLMIFSGINADEKLVGIITKVSKKRIEESEPSSDYCENYCLVSLIGTFFEKNGFRGSSLFKRTINTYPEIGSKSYKASEEAMSIIMNTMSTVANGVSEYMRIGSFASNRSVEAILDGNRFFQRHACIVGSTGSGKSYTVANILENINRLDFSNAIVFDLHGEYNELSYAHHIKVGSNRDDLKIPLWFFNYEEIHSLFIESSESTSSNQRAVVIDFILSSKKDYIDKYLSELSRDIITVDTPIPFGVNALKEYLEFKNTEEILTGDIYKSGDKQGQQKTKQGSHYGKLTNLVMRLQSKIDDKKYSFIFEDNICANYEYLNSFMEKILGFQNNHRIKVIDLSEVPSDMLSIIIGIITRLVYDIQFWMTPNKGEVRHPVTFICDEAHIYMPNDSSKLRAVERKSLEIFERIAKEGRKYGVGLLVISQRPSELNTTIVSQCNNIISLKITNDRDKSAVSNMLTDSLVGLAEMLPSLDVGECIVIGDAIVLPSKIILNEPEEKPKSSTIEFWNIWNNKENSVFDIRQAITNMVYQYRIS